MQYTRLLPSSIIERQNDDGSLTYFDEASPHIDGAQFRQAVKDGVPIGQRTVDTEIKPSFTPDDAFAQFANALIAKGIVAEADLPQAVSDYIKEAIKPRGTKNDAIR